MVPSILFFSIHSLITTAAHAEAAPNKWCPQACPAPVSLSATSLNGELVCASPGRASNSPKIPITGPPLLNSAMKLVGIPATPFWIINPFSSSSLARRFELFVSRYPSSA